MAAEVACSRGDFPVAAVVARLAAVAGYAAAAEPTAVPAELTAAVPLVPRAAIGLDLNPSMQRLGQNVLLVFDSLVFF